MHVVSVRCCAEVIEMDSMINLIVGDLVLSPEYVFAARVICLVLCVEVLTALLSAVVPIVRSTR